MLKVDVYPVLDGVELWVTGMCLTPELSHKGHTRVRVATYVGAAEIDEYGLHHVLARGWEQMLHEYPALVERARC